MYTKPTVRSGIINRVGRKHHLENAGMGQEFGGSVRSELCKAHMRVRYSTQQIHTI